jgi:hypothetical protein
MCSHMPVFDEMERSLKKEAILGVSLEPKT